MSSRRHRENTQPRVIGIDEVGLGAWAGPIYVCAVCMPVDWSTEGLRDSKMLSRVQIEYMRNALISVVEHAVVIAPLEEINESGPAIPLRAAQAKAALRLRERFPEALVVVDGDKELTVPHSVCAPKADFYVPTVMAASIIAKYERDQHMILQGRKYPQYGFESHVGYGVPAHIEAIARYGPCEIHRKTYRPIQRALANGPLPADAPGAAPVTQAMYDAWKKPSP